MSTANHIGRVGAITMGIAALLVMSGSGHREQVSRSGAPALTRLPLAFEPNEGQFPAEERFVSRSGAFALILTDTGAVFRLGDQAVRQKGRLRLPRTEAAIPATLAFSGATAREPRGEGLLPGVANYLIGNDPSLWRTGVRQYARVRYRGIYPGIDVVYHGDQQKLEYDMIVAPNGEPNNIRLAISGGALTLESDGSLAVRSGGRTLLQHRPVAYQELRGERRFVEARYEIAENGREVGIRTGTYDRSAPLVIDPVLDYGVLVGGSGKEGANFLAVDSAGNAYITGTTSSADLGRGASISGSLRGSSDAFVSKLSPTGALLFTTYLGGGGNDVATSVAVNSSGSLFICGVTDSLDYPMAGSTQFPFGGGQEDGFFSILGSSGANLIASTYYGGSGDDVANALALDVNSNAYVAGYTTSTSIPGLATSSLQATNAGKYDAFVAKFSATGSLLFATFYGGTGDDQVYAATTDGLGDAWVTGASDSSALPGGATGNHASGGAGFIFRIASSGSAWKASQFFGGSGDQIPFGIAIDSSGLVWVAGSTNSADYPTTAAALQKTLAGGYDAFLTAFSQSIAGLTTPGLSIAYSTYVGGSGTDIGYTVATGRNQTVYVGGFTSSPNLLPAGRPQPGANKSTFLLELSFASLSTTPSIPTALYLNAQDVSNPVTVALRATSSADEVFLAGYADNTVVFPSSSQGQSPPYHGGTTDAFVAKLAHADLSISSVTTSLSLISTAVSPLAFRVSNAGPSAADTVVVQMTVPSGLIVLSCSARFLCSTSNGVVTVTYPTLAAEASDLITLQVKATSAGVSGSFNAFVTSATNDSSPNNNLASGTFSLAVGQPPFVLNPADVLTFQNQLLGQFSQQSVTLTPVSGAVDIQLSLMPQPGTSAGAFGFAPGTPTNFTASQAQTIPLTFAPNQTGAAGALLMVKAPNAAYTTAVSLGGTGNAPANLPTAFLPEFTVGGGFVMGFYVLNNSANASTFTIAFYDDSGNPVSLPFTAGSATPTLSDTIGPNGAKYYEAGTFDGNFSAGWGAITAPPSITISAILRRRGSDGSYYEAAVPATTGYNEFQIPFDATIFPANGAQIVTGFAIANLDASTPAAVTCTARDSSGNLIPGAVSVPPLNRYGHWASGDFPKLKGLRGTLDCSSNTMVGGLALRFIGTNSQSSLPVTPAGAAGGAGGLANGPTAFLPEFTVGGGFVMGFYVVNNSANGSPFSIAFYDDNGNPVSLPFTAGSATPTLSDTIGPNGAKYYEAGTFDGPFSAGWGAITAPPTITISAILRRRGSDGSYYEAAVPATTGYNEFQIPFDATIFPANGAQIVTGFAIANLDASTPAAVTCTARDSSGNLIPGAVSVPPLNKYGHWASGDFPALKGLRGTLDCSSNTKVGGLALRFIGTNSQSSLPVIPVR